MKCCFLLFALLAAAVVLTESAITKKPISRASRIRRPVSTKTVGKPANKTVSSSSTKSKSAASPAVLARKKPLSTVSKIAVPASSLRAASSALTPEEPPEAASDPVARLAADMARLEKIPDPTEWRDDEFNDLAMLPSAVSAMSNNVIPSDDPFADYEDLLFDDYDVSDTRTHPFGGKYLQSEVCGRKFFCRRGDRGPCQPNEVFTPLPNSTASALTAQVTKPSCSSLITSPWNGCLPSGRLPSSVITSAPPGAVPKGCCSVRFPQRPCFGFPPTYRYSNHFKRCYPCASSNNWSGGLSGPCPPNKIFVDIDGINGMCRCRDRNHLLSKTDDRCYRVYSRGPCGEGQWMDWDTNGYGVCRRSPCPSDKCDGRHIYWRSNPTSPGGCYKSFSRGPCRAGSYFLIEDYATRSGRCVTQYGSSFNPIRMQPAPAYGRMNPSAWMMNSNRVVSPWSNFGMFPPPGLFDSSFGDELEGDDYDEMNWDY